MAFRTPFWAYLVAMGAIGGYEGNFETITTRVDDYHWLTQHLQSSKARSKREGAIERSQVKANRVVKLGTCRRESSISKIFPKIFLKSTQSLTTIPTQTERDHRLICNVQRRHPHPPLRRRVILHKFFQSQIYHQNNRNRRFPFWRMYNRQPCSKCSALTAMT